MQFDSQQIFGPTGILQSNLENYEYRAEQVEMAEHVHNALYSDTHAIVEAGTGVGKSLAYLIPLIYYTVNEKKRAIIATHTLTLQEQLFQKDIPFLKRVLPLDFRVEIFKGRSNYICLHRLQELREGQNDQLGLFDQGLQWFSEWVQTTETGDRSEAPHAIPQELWAQVRCEKVSCPEEQCPHFKSCFYWSLRHKLSQAQLIVTNQAMLLSDVRTSGSVLPKYDAVVIDEAHNLEDTATNSFSYSLSMDQISAYYRSGVGLQSVLRDEVPEHLIHDLRLTLDELFTRAGQYFTLLRPLIPDYSVAITEQNRNSFTQISIPESLREILELLNECELSEGESSGLLNQFVEYTSSLLDTVNLIMSADDPSFVYWGEWQNGEPALMAAPISVQEALSSTLFADTPSVTLTSATLATNKSFDYIRDRLGFGQADELILGSPFDYGKQALLCVPKQAKHPNHPQYPQYTAYLILHTLAAVQGGVLALFTSYSLMDKIADLIQPKLDEVGYTLFKQGDGSRIGLIEAFQTTPHSLLFGTNSFWEGIDLPGDSLKAVVITRLPFAVPDRPVTAARLRAIEQAGGSSFTQYSVPQAILRLKQGFGRLIRTSRDRGGVVIVDERIVTSYYGKQFISSLPPARFTRDISELSSFYLCSLS